MSNFLISYAQNFEDIVLWRALKHIKNGFYVDVGANDPLIDSVTQLFYEHGWSGINIEPSPYYFARLLNFRPKDINLRIGAGDATSKITFFDIYETGLSTFDPKIADVHRNLEKKITEIDIEIDTLDNILNVYQPANIHFLKIDVEGFEKKVIQGLTLKKIRPWILVIESITANSAIQIFDPWESLVLSADYDFVYFDGINRFYLAREHSDLIHAFNCPPNPLDNFHLCQKHHLYHPLDHHNQLVSIHVNQQSYISAIELNAKDREAHLKEVEAWAEASQLWGLALESQVYEISSELKFTKTELENLKVTIHNIHNSTSWRITKYLRTTTDSIRKFVYYPKKIIKKILRPFKPLIKRCLKRVLIIVREYPALYRLIKKCCPNFLITQAKKLFPQPAEVLPFTENPLVTEIIQSKSGINLSNLELSIYEKIALTKQNWDTGK